MSLQTDLVWLSTLIQKSYLSLSGKGAYYNLRVRLIVNGPIQLDIFIIKSKQNKLTMEDLFNETQQNHRQNQIQYQPVEEHTENLDNNQQPPITYVTHEQNNTPINNQSSPLKPTEDNKEIQHDFDEFEQDEVTKKLRQQQQRIQNLLAQKSQRQWDQKQKRRQQAKRQLQEFNAKKEQEKEQRVSENVRKETENKQSYAKINQEAGWKKVTTSINLRQGEHKGSRDISRMREAIQHKRQDDNS